MSSTLAGSEDPDQTSRRIRDGWSGYTRFAIYECPFSHDATYLTLLQLLGSQHRWLRMDFVHTKSSVFSGEWFYFFRFIKPLYYKEVHFSII